MTHILIAGAGIAGVPAAYAIKNSLGPNDRVALVSARADFHVVRAVGSAPAYEEVEGMDPAQGYVHAVVHIEQAIEASQAYKEFVKNPGPIVIGAAAGCAILGPVYETAFLVDADLRRRGLRERVTITLVTPEHYVAHFGIGAKTEHQRLLENALADRGIVFMCNMKTT